MAALRDRGPLARTERRAQGARQEPRGPGSANRPVRTPKRDPYPAFRKVSAFSSASISSIFA
jgi:hypothetical protein